MSGDSKQVLDSMAWTGLFGEILDNLSSILGLTVT